MPCFTVTRTQIQFGVKTDAALLFKALEGLKLRPRIGPGSLSFDRGSFDRTTGQLTLSGNDAEARAQIMRRAYGAEIAKREAARYGWMLAPVTGQPFKYEIRKQ